jgi:hypothetical protein
MTAAIMPLALHQAESRRFKSESWQDIAPANRRFAGPPHLERVYAFKGG